MIGDVITEEEIWACTTCRNCEDQCPVMNEHVDKIIDLRRYLVLTEGKMDSDAQRAMTSIERQGNPWGLNRKERENWRDAAPDAEIPTVKEMKKKEENLSTFSGLVPWGPTITEARKSRFPLPSCSITQACPSRSSAIKKNSGDTPRRLGNEFLFQELAEKNISEFEKMMSKKSLRSIPMHTIYLKTNIRISDLKARFIIIQRCWPSL